MELDFTQGGIWITNERPRRFAIKCWNSPVFHEANVEDATPDGCSTPVPPSMTCPLPNPNRGSCFVWYLDDVVLKLPNEEQLEWEFWVHSTTDNPDDYEEPRKIIAQLVLGHDHGRWALQIRSKIDDGDEFNWVEQWLPTFLALPDFDPYYRESPPPSEQPPSRSRYERV